MSQQDDILRFWFTRSPGEKGSGNMRKVWFLKNSAFDQDIHTRFRLVYEQAMTGAFDGWQETAEGCLALVLLFDQFPRNMFRGTPQAFATDDRALAIAQKALDRRFDQSLPVVQRWFLYMPFEHSENLEHQRRAVELFYPLRNNPDARGTYSYAIKHLAIIEQFGRFPHRNQILGRESTAAEREFLKQPGSSF
ncbi:MAG: DUF924 family protein [Leptolyngbya sp. BL-A-14]